MAAHTHLGFLHRDVSRNNIIIFDGRAILIDWGFAAPIGYTGGQTGTNDFYSVAVSRMRKEDKHVYSPRDDFESLFFTLLCMLNKLRQPILDKREIQDASFATTEVQRLASHHNKETAALVKELARTLYDGYSEDKNVATLFA